jgi:hypothetical protein
MINEAERFQDGRDIDRVSMVHLEVSWSGRTRQYRDSTLTRVSGFRSPRAGSSPLPLILLDQLVL